MKRLNLSRRPLFRQISLVQHRPILQRPISWMPPKMVDIKTPLPSLSSSKTGLFQTITVNNQSKNKPGTTSLTITDALYGSHTLTSQSEPILLALLQSPHLTRLAGVHQHGITGLLNLTPEITRLEHSIGAFLLVRSLGASQAEQAAALLHDVSHTALSHVVDFALTSPSEGSYHEVHKSRYLSLTDLPEIVALYADDIQLPQHGPEEPATGESSSVFHEESFPLLEQPSPHLCADRIDYSLRDAVAFGKLSIQEAQEIFSSFRAFPTPDHADSTVSSKQNRLIVMDSPELALKFARTYNALDRDVWSNPANISMYTAAGGVIRDAVKTGRLDELDLWKLSDEQFWDRLRTVTDEVGRGVMARLEQEGLRETKSLPTGTKVRTLDPDVLVDEGYMYKPLSVVYPAWGVERAEYMNQRKGLIESETS